MDSKLTKYLLKLCVCPTLDLTFDTNVLRREILLTQTLLNAENSINKRMASDGTVETVLSTLLTVKHSRCSLTQSTKTF